MPDNEIKIRVSAKDDGVRDVMRAIRDEMKKTVSEAGKPILGPAIKPRFDFDEKLVRDQMARALNSARSIAEREKIRIQAEVVVREARERINGPDSATPSIDKRAFDVADRSPLEQSQRNRQARDRRAERSGSRLRSAADDEDQERRNRIRRVFGSGVSRRDGENGGGNSDTSYIKQFFQARQILRVATIIGSIPEVAQAYRDALKTGASKFAAAGDAAEKIPFIGEFVKAGRGIGTTFSEQYYGTAKQEYKSELDAQRQAREELEARRESVRRPIRDAIDSGVLSARDRQRTLGKDGSALEAAQAQNEYDHAMAATAKLEHDKKLLSESEQLKANVVIAQLRTTASQELARKLMDIEKARLASEIEAYKEHELRTNQIREQITETRLTMDGRGREARLAQIDAETEAEKDAIAKRLAAELANANADPALSDRAFQRARDDEKLNAERRQQRIDEENQNETRDRVKATHDAENQIAAIRESATSERLRTAGKAREADALDRKAALAKELQDVQDNLDQQVQAHKDREPALRQHAADHAAAIKDKYDADEAVKSAEEAAKFRPDQVRAFSGDSRLLTGVGSAADSTIAPITQTAKSTAEAAKTAADQLKEMHTTNAKIDQLITALNFQPASL